MIGLGVGIDYALFVVTRYRQGLTEGREPREATVVALSHGRAGPCCSPAARWSSPCWGCSWSACRSWTGLAVGAICAVLLVLDRRARPSCRPCSGSPGGRIDRLHVPGLLAGRPPRPSRGFWWRWSRTVQRRPWLCGTAALVVLVVLAIPLFSMRLAFQRRRQRPDQPDHPPGLRPAGPGFGPGFNGPLVIAADDPGRASARRPSALSSALDSRLRSVPGVASVAPAAVQPGGRRGRDHRLPDDRRPRRPRRPRWSATSAGAVIPPAVAGHRA